MPITQNINEAGWFYHAPAKKRDDVDRVEYGAPSQIPGIGFEDPTMYEKEEVRPVVFKESDSKYIQMAKLGGRKDLLSFNPDRYSKKTQDARGYARNEWFYLEDNRLEDEEMKKKENWEFLLPEYMVHKGYQPSFEDPTTPPLRSGAPYYVEKKSAMEGREATDKTVKIPEVRRPGFGVRNEKPPQSMKNLPPREKPARQSKKDQTFKMPTEREEPTNMSKLLAGGYKEDWHSKRGEQESAGQCRDDRVAKHTLKENTNQNNSAVSRHSTQSKKNEEEKDLFKMAKFKNVPSKIDSHQRSEVMPAHHHK